MQPSMRLCRRALMALATLTVLASAFLAVPAATASASPAPARAGAAGAVSVVQPSAVTAAGVRVYKVTRPALLAGIHNCFNLGFGRNSNAHAVYCADLYARPVTGGVIVRAAVEARCQLGATADFPRCASAELVFSLNSAVKKPIVTTADSCGGSLHPCKFGGGNLFLGGNHMSGSVCRTLSSQFWTVVSAGSTIHLPDGEVKRLPANLTSQHAIVCR